MSDPVVLIGTNKDDGALVAVGLYVSIGEAQAAVMRGEVPPGCHYSVMTPPLGKTYSRRIHSAEVIDPA